MNRPLAERMRPKSLESYIGQSHLVGPQGSLSPAIKKGYLPSIILWGPPGVGKTSLARIIANSTEKSFHALSAINSGVKDIREIIERIKKSGFFGAKGALLFIDEIHRFSKSQQDSLLQAVEEGTLTLIGATTENPSFEINNALLSRCQVYPLKPLDKTDIEMLIKRALAEDEELKNWSISLLETESLIAVAAGDARKALNLLEAICLQSSSDKIEITDSLVKDTIKNSPLLFDKKGENHYDTASALIKSIRGSDPQASLYYLAKMIVGGEDPKFIARRLIIAAAEDIGLANPTALVIANNTFQAIERIGMPEGRIILSECVIYLATSAKSNSAYSAINEAMQFVQNHQELEVPMQLRNAPTKLMKDMGYGKDYQYSHNGIHNFVNQEFMPEGAEGTAFYSPSKNPREKEINQRMIAFWQKKYGYEAF